MVSRDTTHCHRDRARPRWFGRRRASCPAHYSATDVGLAYLIVFGLGTVTGMMLMTATIAVPIAYTARFSFLNRHFGTAAGALSLGFGLFLAYQIGFVDGLFTH